MHLGEFVLSNTELIISEWESSARNSLPFATSHDDLRLHAKDILGAIALGLPPLEQPSNANEPVWSSAARAHGVERRLAGFTPRQMVAEFRALRTSVLRLWADAENQFTATHLEDLTRFNDAIDQAIAESMACYVRDLEHAKDVFLEIVGHDLRNPLAAIMISATLIIASEDPAWPHVKTASRIVNSGLRMERIIGELLDFTRCRQGTSIPIVRAETDLDSTCRQAIEEVVKLHPKREVQFDPRGHLLGQWDRGRLCQALYNVICNANLHAPERTPITIVASGATHEVVMTVHHGGRVMPKAELRQLFNPLKSVGPDGAKLRDLSSLGLGLFIAKEIVVAHAGTIEVESVQDRGTTFTIRLPHAAR